MNKLVIYRMYHKESGKSYIGKCSKGDTRIKNHYRDHSNPKCEYRAKLLYRAMKKHGVDKFNHEILYEASTVEELNNKEKEFIDLFRSRDPAIGYNIRHGGDGGNTWEGLSPEDRAARIKKQSEAQTGSYTIERCKAASDRMKAMRVDKVKSAKNAQVCSERMKRLNKDPNFGLKSKDKR